MGKKLKDTYRVIVDSCGEFPELLKADARFARAPLTIDIDGYEITDDDSFDQADFLDRVKKSPNPPKSACPSPETYYNEMSGDEERVYVITLSAQLSGSYNSAMLAKNLYEEEYGDEEKRIYVFDSKSASIGQTLIALKIRELEEEGLPFAELVINTESYIRRQHTFFVLETLENLRKAGRLGNLKAMIAGTLNIKPIMGSTDNGDICQLAQARGMTKAIERMVSCMLEVTSDVGDRILAISHCNAPDLAKQLKECVAKAAKFKDILILDTAGISSMYAGDGGIIMVT